MRVEWVAGAAGLAQRAASEVAGLCRGKPDAVLALPTGATPLGLYAELVRLHREGGVSFRQARFFNLDEYAGLAPDDANSYAAYLGRNLLDPIDAAPDRVRLLRGDAADPAAECRAYDAAIAASGGIDLAILGLGVNGHVAFNEPGVDWTLRTHRVALAPSTLARAGDWGVPTHALTMGLGTLRRARALLMLVIGEDKAPALAALLRGRPDPAWPGTALLDHANLLLLADRALRPAAP
jgi:glucosamine-6-phosphate deaminase